MNPEKKQPVSFGILLAPVYPWPEFVRHAQMIEALGFDKLWLPDHFVRPDKADVNWFDCWSALTALATKTDRIRLGSLVASMTLYAIRLSWPGWL